MQNEATMVHHRGQKSMYQKRTERLQSKRAHEGNVTAGHVDTNEKMLHRSGLRGRKSTAFVVLLTIIAIVVIVNFLLTIIILSVFRLKPSGSSSLYTGTDKMVVFRGNARLFNAQVRKFIGAYVGESMVISSLTNEQLRLAAGMYNGTRRQVILTGDDSSSAIEFRSTLRVQQGEKWLAKFGEDSAGVEVRKLISSHSIATFTDTGIETKRVESNGTDLTFVSETRIGLRRADKISLLSNNADFDTDNGNITISSQNSQRVVTFSASNFKLTKLPQAGNSPVNVTQSFKLCACVSVGTSGRQTITQFYQVQATAQGCMTTVDPCSILG